MLIQVTEEHVRRGIRTHPRHCPIALAVAEYFTETAAVLRRSIETGYFGNPNRFVTVNEESLAKAITEYDFTGEMTPGFIDIDDEPDSTTGFRWARYIPEEQAAC